MGRAVVLGAAFAAAVLGACGGGDGGDGGGAKSGPTLAEVIAVARKNPGFRRCKKVEPGARQTSKGAGEADYFQALLCDRATVGSYFFYPDDASAAAYDQSGQRDRPWFVNGRVVVSTGDAVFAKTYAADAAKSLAGDVKSSCGCGEVKP